VNLYGYVNNNPIRYRDPLGLWVEATYDVAKHKFELKEVDRPSSEGPNRNLSSNSFFSGNGTAVNDPFRERDKGVGPNNESGPIPMGNYIIQEATVVEPREAAAHPEGDWYWYKLWRDTGTRDGSGNQYQYTSFEVEGPQDPETGEATDVAMRGQFTIHTGLESDGCMTSRSTKPRKIGNKINPGYPYSPFMQDLHQVLDHTPTRRFPGLTPRFVGSLIVK
jgi:hypothetical protein